LIDVHPNHSGVRSLFLAFVVAGILPSIERYGVLVTDAIGAGIAWAGFLYVRFP
jgi:hypothetical protein